MNSLIDTPEINNVLFGHQRDFFIPENERATTLSFVNSEGVSFAARFFADSNESPNMIFFPSSELSLARLETMAEDYVKEGINLLLLSYRVDNTDAENCTLEQFLKDAHFLFNEIKGWLSDNGYTGKLFVMGQSIGTVAAVDIMHSNKDDLKALFLESAIGDTESYLASLGIDTAGIEKLEESGFGVISKIEEIKKPTFIFHGANDERTPISVAEKLQACSGARSKQFFIIPGGKHEELYKAGGALFYETIKKFIDTICGVNTWRQRRKKYKEGRKG